MKRVIDRDVATVPVARREPPSRLTSERLNARRRTGDPFPVVADGLCTFAFNGPVISVRLTHFGVGLPDDLRFERRDEDWWLLTLEIPRGSRIEYKLDVTDSFGTRMIEDPLNPNRASHPFGANSVCEAEGYLEPDWSHEHPNVPAGSIDDFVVNSAALGRTARSSVYRPATFAPTTAERYPLAIVHDGSDYLRYASVASVFDNLIHRGRIPPTVVAFIHPEQRLVEYADDPRHRQYLTTELIPQLETDLPLIADRTGRCLMGASFGAVASMATAFAAPNVFGGLLLQSGSFAGAGTGCWPRPEPLWQPVKEFVRAYLATPKMVADRVYVSCGVYESLICENRGLVPVLRSSGMDVRFDETLDGHNWASWRDSLGSALPYLLG